MTVPSTQSPLAQALSSSMKSPKQLVHSTLNLLGQQLLGLQCELAQVQLDQHEIEDNLFGCVGYGERVKTQIQALKRRILWEQKEGARLRSTGPTPDGRAPDAWQGDA